MKRLYDLSIRRKFAVVIIPLIITIICFDYLQIKDKYLDYQDAARLNKAIIVGIEINHAVHEIQKERSVATGFIASEGLSFQERLIEQRSRTDSTLNEFFKEIVRPELSDLVQLHNDDIKHLQENFGKIDIIRDQVDNLEISTKLSIEYFSDVNNAALNTVNYLINETRNKEVAQQVHAIIYFLKSKEYASIERAIGTQAFSHSHLDYETYNNFTSIVAAQQAFKEAFITIANEESIEFYERLLQGPDVEEVQRLRDVLFANTELNEDPNYWYKVSTNRINALKKVEDLMSDRIHDYTERISQEAKQSFWTFLVLDLFIGLSAFWLMSTIVSNMLENVKKLEDYTKKISRGDLTQKAQIPTKDELGQYADTFNIMVDEVKKSQAALKKERDHARYLYENIYKQAEVVFENVQQGIFLLDKNFQISKLYSKSMEAIFDRKKIGGENFANFMRPLIIPRELEALEMFMRHLFNEDMDEEVVNQLNPIEEVKIFTDKDGTVSPKYIQVAFTRILRKGKIQNIMVTVSDETQSVLLRQHLEEAEQKKKQETEQVLSILKIDPAVLRGFLFNTKKTLAQISEKYEAHQGENYVSLLDFTFETIHNLKGNSTVIGLELMSSKFHAIEEEISKLKGAMVAGKDFLKILYDIDEANKMLEDMAEMLRKIANIYKKIPAEGQVVSNIMVMNTLQQGVEKMSEEMGKPASLKLKNDKNIVIPDAYIDPFKDIMIQLIKNSMAHGIEASDIRMARGKAAKGNLTIDLSTNAKDDILIAYRDDGGGLNLDKIKEKAIERNVVTEFEVENLPDEKVPELIFKKGFSTSEKADHYSGRGQGMNLVKNIIEDKKGGYSVNFESEKFFEIIIRLPSIYQDEAESILS